jgi:hypothetical protein
MSRGQIVALVVALVAAAGSAEPAAEKSPAEVSRELRERLLKGSAKEYEITPDGKVWGVLMETGHEDAAVTLVALADGTASLYFSSGGGVIGGGPHEDINAAAKRMVHVATGFLAQLEPTKEFPLPAFQRTRFYVLTTSGVLTAEAAEDDLGNRRHALTPLFYAGQDVITGLRLATQRKKRAE